MVLSARTPDISDTDDIPIGNCRFFTEQRLPPDILWGGGGGDGRPRTSLQNSWRPNLESLVLSIEFLWVSGFCFHTFETEFAYAPQIIAY